MKPSEKDVQKTRTWLESMDCKETTEDVAGRRLSYFVIPQEKRADLPYFAYQCVNSPSCYVLGVSDSVPVGFRKFWALHEYVEYAEHDESKETDCVDALNEELIHVPENVREQYISLRYQLFKALDKANDTSDELRMKVRKTIGRLEEIMNSYSK